MANLEDRRKEAVLYDLDLYFFLNSLEEEKTEYKLKVNDYYLGMNKISWDEWFQILEEFCKENDLKIRAVQDGLSGTFRVFEISKRDRADLIQETAQ